MNAFHARLHAQQAHVYNRSSQWTLLAACLIWPICNCCSICAAGSRGAFVIDHDHATPGVVHFHLVLGRQCSIRTAAGRLVTMRSGDFLMLPRGDAHSIVSVQSERSDQPPRVFQIAADGMLPMRTNRGADLLCGHFTYAPDSPSLLLAKAFKASRQATPAQFRRSLSVWKARTSSANPASVEP